MKGGVSEEGMIWEKKGEERRSGRRREQQSVGGIDQANKGKHQAGNGRGRTMANISNVVWGGSLSIRQGGGDGEELGSMADNMETEVTGGMWRAGGGMAAAR